MEIEYLDGDEDNIVTYIYDSDNNNECNVKTSQTRKSNIIDEESINLQKVVEKKSGKENIEKTQNYKIIRDNQQCTAKFDKSIEKSAISINSVNSSENIQNNKKEQTTFNVKERNTRCKQLKNSIEVSAHLTNVYDETYKLKKNYHELKKSYYERKLDFVKRFVEATEKVSNILEQYFSL